MTYLRAMYEEYKINIYESFSYKFGIISDILVFGVLQVFLFFANTGSSLSNVYSYSNSKELLLVGYITWMLSCACISHIGGEVKNEMAIGTFYHKINASIPINILYIGKLLASLTTQIITIFTLMLISNVLFGVKISFNFTVILTILICMIGMYGIGLAIGGFAVYYKQISSIVFIIQLLLLLATDVLSKNTLPIFKLIPLTFCNDLIRKIISKVQISIFEYTAYILVCLMFYIVGVFVLKFMIGCARKKGNLLHF